MLQLQFLFFASLAAGATALAWFGHLPPAHQAPLRFARVSVGSWLLSAALLFLGMWIFTPKEPALHFPTSLAAHAVPMLVAAVALALVNRHWSREGKILFALALSAGLAFFAIFFLLLATCIVQSNCL